MATVPEPRISSEDSPHCSEAVPNCTARRRGVRQWPARHLRRSIRRGIKPRSRLRRRRRHSRRKIREICHRNCGQSPFRVLLIHRVDRSPCDLLAPRRIPERKPRRPLLHGQSPGLDPADAPERIARSVPQTAAASILMTIAESPEIRILVALQPDCSDSLAPDDRMLRHSRHPGPLLLFGMTRLG